MYIHHGIHDLIFNFVGTLEASQVLHLLFDLLKPTSPSSQRCYKRLNVLLSLCLPSSQDAAFNKTARGLQDLQQKDLGVKPEFRSVWSFCVLNSHLDTVLEECACFQIIICP